MTNRNLSNAGEALTRDEAAEALRISVTTVDRYVKDGTLASIRIGKRLVRIPREAVDAMLTGTTGTVAS